MPRVTLVKKARKTPGKCGRCAVTIKKGESYFHWKFRFGGKNIRCINHRPRQSELTQSDKLSTIYSAVENMEDALTDFDEIGVADLGDKDALLGGLEELKSAVESAKEEIEQTKDDYEQSRDNMPESLQDGPTGQEIEEKANALEEFAGELDEAVSEIDDAISKIENETNEQPVGDVGAWLDEIKGDVKASVESHVGSLNL